MSASQGREGDERRSERRARTLKRARIIFNHGYGVFDCVVRNLSPTGALLDLPSLLGVPAHFDIAMDGAPGRACTVRWHTDHLMGVQFDDAVAKAA
ncbi:hypothetical protein BH10PSE9_BH10PSE9_06490 [soil metagenome]